MADQTLTDRVAPLRVGSLFSGYGGLDLAVEEVFNARTCCAPGLMEALIARKDGSYVGIEEVFA